MFYFYFFHAETTPFPTTTGSKTSTTTTSYTGTTTSGKTSPEICPAEDQITINAEETLDVVITTVGTKTPEDTNVVFPSPGLSLAAFFVKRCLESLCLTDKFICF